MDRRTLAHWRLRNQRLIGPPLDSAEAVVGWLVAVQAQEYPYAGWSLGKRTTGLYETDVDRLLADGRILRTHIMRPTWHFVLPADIRWLMALTGPRIEAGNRLWYQRVGLDLPTLTRALDTIGRELAGGRRRTRRQLAAALTEAGIEPSGNGLAYICMRAELELLICSGGPAGNQQTYALVDEVVPPAPALPRDEALALLARRYLASHGPATVHDMAWWSGLKVSDCRQAIAAIGTELTEFAFEGDVLWATTDEPLPTDYAPAANSPVAHLLQAYDEYIVGYSRTRSVMFEPGLSDSAWTEGPFWHAIVIDGRLAGHWRRVAKPQESLVETKLLRDLTSAESDALDDALQRYGRFRGVPTRRA